MTPMLVLVDIDGTLLLGSPLAHQEALAAAIRRVVGIPVTGADIHGVDPRGRVDREILRLVLERTGVEPSEVSGLLPELADRADAEHARLVDDHPEQRIAPGAHEALEAMAGVGLTMAPLTGNLRGIAHRKLRRAGLDRHLDLDGGAYGSDADLREALVPIARDRAGAPELGAVVVGDTPRDIDCARAGGARCVAVATSGFSAQDLRGADHVAHGLAEAAEVVLDWHHAAGER